MKLSKQSIIKQLCYELLACVALDLRPERILGTSNLNQAFQLYKSLLRSCDFINTNDKLIELEKYSLGRHNLESAFVQHFGVNYLDSPREPSFCSTPLFQLAIEENQLLAEYDEAAQRELIKRRKAFAFPPQPDKPNGVLIAVRTNNHEMLAFLLDPEFSMFHLERAYQDLLDDPLATSPEVRQVIFTACGKRFTPPISLDELLSRMKNADEWIALYRELAPAVQQQLCVLSTPDIWKKLKLTQEQKKTILELLPTDKQSDFLSALVTIISDINDGGVVVDLMDRLNQSDRQRFVSSLGDRATVLFKDEANLQSCMRSLGYHFNDLNQLMLDHLHLSDRKLTWAVQQVNQHVWMTHLPIHQKIQYLFAIQQVILAPPSTRQSAIYLFEAHIKHVEALLREQADAGLNWFWRMWNIFGRFLGIIPDFAITQEATALLNMMKATPSFNAAIHDLKNVILPNEPPESERRKKLVRLLMQTDYNGFWAEMNKDERTALLIDQSRFKQLFQIGSDERFINHLIDGLSAVSRDELFDDAHPEALLSLLDMDGLGLSVIFDAFKEDRKNRLLMTPAWFGIIVSKLSEQRIQALMTFYDEHAVSECKTRFSHIQAVLSRIDVNRFDFLAHHFFTAFMPFGFSPADLGRLCNDLTTDKLLPFVTLFLNSRPFNVHDMAQWLQSMADIEKKQVLITHWFSLKPHPINEWHDDLFVLLPAMTVEQQQYILNLMTDADLRGISSTNQISDLLAVLKRDNHLVYLNRYRTACSNDGMLNHFLDQLTPEQFHLLLNEPPYDFLKLLDDRDLLHLIRALKCRNDEQWAVVLPKLLRIAEHVFNQNDEVLRLLKEAIPAETHTHVLNVLRNASDEAIQALFGTYLKLDMVQALIKHKKLDFNAITLASIQDMLHSGSEEKAPLIQLTEVSFRELITLQMTTIQREAQAFISLFTEAQIGLLALMVPVNGWTKWYFSPPILESIVTQWGIMSGQLQTLILNHAELINLASIRHYDQVIEGLKPIHEALSALIERDLMTFDKTHHDSVIKSKLTVAYPHYNTPVLQALDSVSSVLRKMDSEDEARLLDNIPDEAVIHKMKTGTQIHDFFSWIVTPENQVAFLARCRRMLETHMQWSDLSPSALEFLSKDAPKVLFERMNPKGHFVSLIQSFQSLTLEQWASLCPNLLANRHHYFSDDDQLVQLLDVHSPDEAHGHILSIIRAVADQAKIDGLLEFLGSGELRIYREHEAFPYLDMTIDNLPDFKQKVDEWFVARVKGYETMVDKDCEQLQRALASLITTTKPIETSGFFWGMNYVFNMEAIEPCLSRVPSALDQFKKDLATLHALYQVKSDDSSNQFISHLEEVIKREIEKMTAHLGQDKLSSAPNCIYRDQHQKMSVKKCLEVISKELKESVDLEEMPTMDRTLSTLSRSSTVSI